MLFLNQQNWQDGRKNTFLESAELGEWDVEMFLLQSLYEIR